MVAIAKPHDSGPVPKAEVVSALVNPIQKRPSRRPSRPYEQVCKVQRSIAAKVQEADARTALELAKQWERLQDRKLALRRPRSPKSAQPSPDPVVYPPPGPASQAAVVRDDCAPAPATSQAAVADSLSVRQDPAH